MVGTSLHLFLTIFVDNCRRRDETWPDMSTKKPILDDSTNSIISKVTLQIRQNKLLVYFYSIFISKIAQCLYIFELNRNLNIIYINLYFVV